MFHEHYCSEGHQGIENWSVTLIDQVEDLDSLMKRELYWINRLNTCAANGLYVREVYVAYNWVKKEKTFLEKAKVLYLHTDENVFQVRYCRYRNWDILTLYHYYYYHYYYYFVLIITITNNVTITNIIITNITIIIIFKSF